MRKELSNDFYRYNKPITISEAIVKRVPDDEVDAPKYIYDITFPETQQCRKSNQMVVGGVICTSCYMRALGDKMCSLNDEQRRPFLEHQIRLHHNSKKWLKELILFVAEFEIVFDKRNFSLAPKWTALIDEIQNGNSSNQLETTQYNLPENFKLKTLNIKADKLDIYQTAILFHLFREADVFINYSNTDLAKLAHYLTGHSEQNLRTDKGFSNIHDIMLMKRKGVKSYNLLALKKVLSEVIDKIDSLSK